MQIPRNDGLSINIHIGCLYINHADLSILDILYSNFFSVPSHAKNHKVGWICCDPAGTSCQCSTAQQYCGKPCVWPSCNMYLFQKDDQRFSVKKKQHFSESVEQKSCNSHVDIKGNTTLIRFIWLFWPWNLHEFQPCHAFPSFFFQVKEEMNLRQYHPGILESPHQPLKIGLLGDCFPFGARPSWKGFCYVRFEKRICFFSTASLRSFSKLGMVYSFHMLE